MEGHVLSPAFERLRDEDIKEYVALAKDLMNDDCTISSESVPMEIDEVSLAKKRIR